MQDGWTPFHFFEIPFPVAAWRMALGGAALVLGVGGLAAWKRSRPNARLLLALAGAVLGAEGVRTACSWMFEHDSWAGFLGLLGACAFGGAWLGAKAAGNDLPPAAPGADGPGPGSSGAEDARAWLKLDGGGGDGQAQP